MSEKIIRTEEQWQSQLSEDSYRVTRQAATERPFTGQYLDNVAVGEYHCICCGELLFQSDNKFDSHCGWPSFDQTAVSENITELEDTSLGRVRTEVICSHCDAHLGHVFTDGPRETTGLRYCINSVALSFKDKDTVIAEFITKLDRGEVVLFTDTLVLIQRFYHFTPTTFRNGDIENIAGENNGSCQVFAFAQQHGLTAQQTLNCFAEHYQAVLATPDGTDHQNIRQFRQTGVDGVIFSGKVLTAK